MVESWIAVAATFALIGTAYQCFTNMWAQVTGMKFFDAHSELVRENARATRQEVAWWRPIARRKRKRIGLQQAFSLLDEDEQAQARGYDRDALGWAFLLVGALTATVISWVGAISASFG